MTENITTGTQPVMTQKNLAVFSSFFFIAFKRAQTVNWRCKDQANAKF